MVTTFLPLQVYGNFSRRSMAANSAVQGLIWPNFEPIQDLIVDLITCKNEEDPIKNKSAIMVTTLFIDLSDAQGQRTPKTVMESCRNLNLSKLL